MVDVLAAVVIIGAVGWSQYHYYFVIVPFLDERDKRKRSFFPSIAMHRDWKIYVNLIEKEEGRAAARTVKIQGIVLSAVFWLLVIVLLYRRAGL